MARFFYRAGYPFTGTPVLNKGWLRIGPYVVGNVASWDRSNCG